MAVMRKTEPGEVLLGKLEHGADLLGEMTKVCAENNVRLGTITALGAVQKARLAYYDQNGKVYDFFEIDRHLEIAALVGNVSLKDGSPIVHAHVTLSDEEGKAFGGHLAEGAIIFACEVAIQVLEGGEFNRGLDEITGLPLWDF